jgi:hypothetical protein
MKGKRESAVNLRERALKHVMKAYGTYSKRAELENKWDEYEKLYNSIPTKKSYDGIANLCPPATNRAGNALLNFCDEALWSKEPAFKLVGVGGKGDQKRAEINERILRLQMEKIGFRKKLREFIEKEIKYGFGIAKVPYVLKEKYAVKQKRGARVSLNFLREENIDETREAAMGIKEKTPTYDNIDFIAMSPRNVYWDYYKKWDEQRAIIEKRINVTNSDLRLMKKINPESYIEIEDILKDETKDEGGISEGYVGAESQEKNEQGSFIEELTGLSGDFGIRERGHEILECWCNFDIDNDGIEEECVIEVLDRKRVIRLELNPYDYQEKPYVFCAWESIEGAGSLGLGIVEKAKRSQLALNDFTNQLMDDITMSLNCMWIIDSTAGISKDQLKSRPGGIVESNNMGGILPLRPPNVASEVQKAIMMTKDDIHQATGATVSLQGMPARYDTTATEASQMANSAQRDAFMKLRDIEESVLNPFLRMAYSYNLQYMSTLDVEKIIGQDAFRASLTEAGGAIEENGYDVGKVLEGDYDFMPLGVTQVENKIIKGQQAMNLYNIAIKSPAGIWNIKNLAKLIVKYVGDGDESMLADDIEEGLISPKDENVLMEQGERPQAKMVENHKEHILTHEWAQLPKMFEEIRSEHIGQHLRYIEMQNIERANEEVAAQRAGVPV